MNTKLALMSIYEACDIPLDKVAQEYFGMAPKRANTLARAQKLPVPVYRTGGQKSPWLVSVDDLANHIEKSRTQAQEHWSRMHHNQTNQSH